MSFLRSSNKVLKYYNKSIVFKKYFRKNKRKEKYEF